MIHTHGMVYLSIESVVFYYYTTCFYQLVYSRIGNGTQTKIGVCVRGDIPGI